MAAAPPPPPPLTLALQLCLRPPSTTSSKPLRLLCYGASRTGGHSDYGTIHCPWAPDLGDALGSSLCSQATAIGLCGQTARDLAAAASAAAAATAADPQDDPKSRAWIRDGCGHTAPNLIDFLDERAAAGDPIDVVLIMLGTNDVGWGLAAEDVAANVIRLHTLCHDRGLHTVVLPLPDSAAYHRHPAACARRMEINKALAEFAAAADPDRCHFAAALEHGFPYDCTSDDWDFDGLHFTRAGYERFGRLVADTIRPWIARLAIAAASASSSYESS